MEKKKNKIQNPAVEDVSPFSPTFSKNFTIIIKVETFSSCTKSNINEHLTYNCNDVAYENIFRKSMVFMDFICKHNVVYVSIMLRLYYLYEIHNFVDTKLRCVASVIDILGNKRFSQTLSYNSDFDTRKSENDSLILSFDKYIKRSSLFNDATELLPKDTLTLCLDIDYLKRNLFSNLPDLGYDTNEDGELCMNMEFTFGRYFSEVSNVFKTMVETLRTERSPWLVPLRSEEGAPFGIMCEIMKNDDIGIKIGEICKFYEFADKYDVELGMKLCREWLMCIMRAITSQRTFDYVKNNIHIISELAERFDRDKVLKNVLEIYSDIERKFHDYEGELEASGFSKLETEWTCEYKEDYFLFSKNKSECIQMDFYK